jgi:protein-S-isoprenylcysteine O-methyltransferase Ste14
MKNPTIMPPTWLLIAMLTMLALRFFFPVLIVIPAGWNLLGLLPMLLGLGITLPADQAFHRAKTTVKPFEESSVLVTEGVFQISRNPMYLGFVLLLIGIATWLQALTPCLVVPAFAILIDQTFIATEERMLEKRFGDEYEQYRHRVRRWL